MLNKDKKEYWVIASIVAMVLVIFILFYIFFFKNIEKKNGQEILKDRNNVELIDNQKNTLDQDEVDIKEIEKRLDELDINLDDIFEQLD